SPARTLQRAALRGPRRPARGDGVLPAAAAPPGIHGQVPGRPPDLRMKNLALLLAGFVFAASAPLPGQTPQPTPVPPTQPGQEMVLKITKEAGRKQSFAIPSLLAPGAAAMQSRVVEPFTASLRSDLEYTGLFVIADPAHYPTGSRDPSTVEVADQWRGTGAEYLVDTRGEVTGDRVSVEARVWDLKAHQP